MENKNNMNIILAVVICSRSRDFNFISINQVNKTNMISDNNNE